MTSNLYIGTSQQKRPKGEGVGRPLWFPVKIIRIIFQSGPSLLDAEGDGPERSTSIAPVEDS